MYNIFHSSDQKQFFLTLLLFYGLLNMWDSSKKQVMLIDSNFSQMSNKSNSRFLIQWGLFSKIMIWAIHNT